MPIYTPLRFRISPSPRNPKKNIPARSAPTDVSAPGRTASAAAARPLGGRHVTPAAAASHRGPGARIRPPRPGELRRRPGLASRRDPPPPRPPATGAVAATAPAAAAPGPAARHRPAPPRTPPPAVAASSSGAARPPLPHPGLLFPHSGRHRRAPALVILGKRAGEQYPRDPDLDLSFRLTSLPRNPNFRANFDCLYLRNRSSVLGV